MVNVNVNFSALGVVQLVIAAIFLIWGFLSMLSAATRANPAGEYGFGLLLVGVAIVLASLAFSEHKQDEILELLKSKK